MIDFEKLGMGNFSNNPLYVKYLSALNKFMEDNLPHIEHTHVFLTGSFLTGKLNEKSDLDLDIISPNTTEQKVIKIMIDGVEVEYATFSFKMIENWLDGNEYKEKVLLAKAVSSWRMIAGKEFPTEIVNKAKRIVAANSQ